MKGVLHVRACVGEGGSMARLGHVTWHRAMSVKNHMLIC